MPWAREIAAVFAPNRAVSAGAMRVIVATQVALALLFWWSSPLPILPRPDEVYRALGVLWFEQGLGRELWTSVLVNLEALAFTLAISLGLSYLTVLPIFRPIAAAASKGRFLGLIGLTFVFTLLLGGGGPSGRSWCSAPRRRPWTSCARTRPSAG